MRSGRITKLLLTNFPEIKEYFAFNLSAHQVENAKININGMENSAIVQFAVSDIQSLQPTKKYDLVIASEVLMHILPSEIQQIIQKLIGFSTKYVCNIDCSKKKFPKMQNRLILYINMKRFTMIYHLSKRYIAFQYSKRRNSCPRLM